MMWNMVIFLVAAVGLSACSGSARTAMPDEETIPDRERVWSEVETIPVPEFDEKPVEVSRTVVHDVPRKLLLSQTDDGISEERAGFRVQVFSSINQRETIQYEARVVDWIESRSPEELKRLGIRGAEEIYNIFSSPYYRVRIGNFLSRQAAANLQTSLLRQFPNVLIVPDRVRVIR